MRNLLALLCALNACSLTACVESGPPRTDWHQAAARIAGELCNRCAGEGDFPTDNVYCVEVLLSPGGGLRGAAEPESVDTCQLDQCLDSIASLETCDGYRTPPSCLALIFGDGEP